MRLAFFMHSAHHIIPAKIRSFTQMRFYKKNCILAETGSQQIQIIKNYHLYYGR